VITASIRKHRTGTEWATYAITQVPALALRTWFLMLVIGSIHHEFAPALPALSYWNTLLLILGFNFLVQGAIRDGVEEGLREELR
jgi:hypothetical protein